MNGGTGKTEKGQKYPDSPLMKTLLKGVAAGIFNFHVYLGLDVMEVLGMRVLLLLLLVVFAVKA